MMDLFVLCKLYEASHYASVCQLDQIFQALKFIQNLSKLPELEKGKFRKKTWRVPYIVLSRAKLIKTKGAPTP